MSESNEELKLLRLARTLQTIPDHARELREYVTLQVLVYGQFIEPLFPRFSHDGIPLRNDSWSRNGQRMMSAAATTLSPDGCLVLTHAENHTWRVWDTLTGRQVTAFPPGERVFDAVFGASGRLVSSREDGQVIRLWDAAVKPVIETAPFPGTVRLVELGPGDRRLVIVGDPKPGLKYDDPVALTQVELFDGPNGHRIAVLRGHVGSINAVAFSPDGSLILTGGEDRTARVWSADDGRLLRTLDGHKTTVSWVGFNPTNTFACTAGEGLQWWRLPDWQPAGFSSNWVPYGNVEFLHPEVVASQGWLADEATGVWIHRRTDQQILTIRHAHYEPTEAHGIASDGKRVLVGTGEVYDFNDPRQAISTPPGKKYHPDARRLVGERRFAISPLGIIDLVVEKQIAPGWSGGRPITAPGCLCFGFKGTSPVIIPSLDIDIPFATLGLWAQVVARGNLDPSGAFVKWIESEWDLKRSELASIGKPIGAFPFPGHVARDRLYWLRKEIEGVGQRPEVIRLMDRLIADEPTWPNYLRRGELLWTLNSPGLAARDIATAARLAGPRFWPSQPDYRHDWGRSDWTTGGVALSVARQSGHQPEEYEAALVLARELAKKWRSDWLIGTLLYRLGRHQDALDVLSREEWENVGTHFAAASASPWAALLLMQAGPRDVTVESVKAMCLLQLGRPDASKRRLALARQAADQKGPELTEDEKAFHREAEELIEGKKP